MAAQEKRSRSIFATILIPSLVLLVIELIVLLSVLLSSGALTRLEQNEREILHQQVITRRDTLQEYFTYSVANLETLTNAINEAAAEMHAEGKLNLDAIDHDVQASAELQSRIINPMVDALRSKKASGVFVVFNTEDLSVAHATGSYGQRTGVYIRDLDPLSTPSPRNIDIVIEVGSTAVVQSSRITTSSSWTAMFNLDDYGSGSEYDFLYQPFQVAYEASGEKVATDYAYWGTSPRIGTGTGLHNIAHTVPLILEDGTVYGIVGIDLSVEYMRTMLPYQELLNNQGASYVLATTPIDQDSADTAARVIVLSGRDALGGIKHGEGMLITTAQDGVRTYVAGDESYYIDSEPLDMYQSNSPVEDRNWDLLAAVPNATLHQFVDHVRRMIVTAALVMLALGIAGAILMGRFISNPIRKLSQEVERTQLDADSTRIPVLSRTGITEVDQLTGAITSLSNDIASVRFLEQQRIEYERDYDMLTGLKNRRAFYREAGKTCEGEHELNHAAVVILDLDNLKDINDTYGHDWGDRYMHAAARCFEDAVPPETLLARVSGDEFYLLFCGYESEKALTDQIDKLRESIEKSEFIFPDGKKDHIAVSGGVALCPRDADEFTELMRLADFTMYQVKDGGKDRIDFFDAEHYQRGTTALRAVSELDDLLNDYTLATYHFQPVFDAHSGKAVAYEALLRVDMENLRNAGDVLTYARQEKRLADVERMTWMRSFECYHNLLRGGQVSEDALLFINTFANVTFDVDELNQFARDNQDIMQRLVIEITETDTMDGEATAIKRGLPGFSGAFALDDYGSGYNSEVMLLELKPSYIKVDISIVRGIDASADKQRIVSQIVDYAHERGMLIVAEGVETGDELDTLISLGVDLLQGFYLARPAAVPATMSEEGLKHILAAQEKHSSDA